MQTLAFSVFFLYKFFFFCLWTILGIIDFIIQGAPGWAVERKAIYRLRLFKSKCFNFSVPSFLLGWLQKLSLSFVFLASNIPDTISLRVVELAFWLVFVQVNVISRVL